MLGERPQSGNDKRLLPLQAADLLAWRIRRIAEDQYGGRESIADVLLPLRVSVETTAWDRTRLQNNLDRLIAMKRETGRQFPYDELNRKDRRKAEKILARQNVRSGHC
jgi:hypothetical protein